MFNTLQNNDSILWLMDSAIQMLFSVWANWAVRSRQMRIVEAQNPWGNVLRFKTPHPIISWRMKFFYGEESIATRFKEHECSCEEDTDPETSECVCYNVRSIPNKRNELKLSQLSPWSPLQNNSFKIYWWYAWWGNLWDRVEIKFCGWWQNCCTAPNQSVYMEYAFGAPKFKTIHDTIPVSPAYLVPLSFFAKMILAPWWENRLAWQETNYYQIALDMVKELDRQDRVLNPKWIVG